MKRFEYKTIELTRQSSYFKMTQIDIPQLESLLAKMGNEGWELVTSIEQNGLNTNDYFCLIFKRQILEN